MLLPPCSPVRSFESVSERTASSDFPHFHTGAQSYEWTLDLQRCNGIMSRNSIIPATAASRARKKQTAHLLLLTSQRCASIKKKDSEGVERVEFLYQMWSYSLLPSQLVICCISAWTWIPILSSWNRNHPSTWASTPPFVASEHNS